MVPTLQKDAWQCNGYSQRKCKTTLLCENQLLNLVWIIMETFVQDIMTRLSLMDIHCSDKNKLRKDFCPKSVTR